MSLACKMHPVSALGGSNSRLRCLCACEQLVASYVWALPFSHGSRSCKRWIYFAYVFCGPHVGGFYLGPWCACTPHLLGCREARCDCLDSPGLTHYIGHKVVQQTFTDAIHFARNGSMDMSGCNTAEQLAITCIGETTLSRRAHSEHHHTMLTWASTEQATSGAAPEQWLLTSTLQKP